MTPPLALSFQAPLLLLLLLGIPLLILLAYATRERQRRYAVRYPAAPILAAAMEQSPSWQRVVAPVLALLAIAFMVVAVARPQHKVAIPVQQASIVLVTDHSGSMAADDVEPTRLDAAEKAAQTFIDKLPSAVKVGAVAFSDAPDAVQTPSTDHNASRQIIAGQQPGGGTASGDALAAALTLLQPQPGKKAPPSAVVMLSDGQRTEGSDPLLVAQVARRRHVPVYTVALGTPGAVIPDPTDPAAPPISVSPDPELLRAISKETKGVAYTAQDQGRLNDIYKRLGSQLGSKSEQRQLTVWPAAIAFILLLGAAIGSVLFSGRLP